MEEQCGKCGAEFGSDVSFCPSCGKPTKKTDDKDRVHSTDVIGEDPLGEAVALGFYASLAYTVLVLFASIFMGGSNWILWNPVLLAGPVGIVIFGVMLLILAARVSELV